MTLPPERKLLTRAVSWVFAWSASLSVLAADPAIDCDFPGGNIVVERIEGENVYVHQDPRDTEGFWFYWCFRVREAAGRTLAFHFTKGNVLGVLGPAASVDGGATWTWLGPECMNGPSFTYTVPKDVVEVRFSLGMPYQESDLKAFFQRHAGNVSMKVEPHATSRKGRAVSRLRLGKLDGPPSHRVMITCRHHACEMMASWMLEGLLEEVLADSEDGRWLRDNVEFLVVPMMDLDGVEDGDHGKNRRPHDHNRDYMGESIYPEVAALREFAPAWADGRLRISLDMHCPWIRGGNNEELFFVGVEPPEIWAAVLRLSRILEETQTGPLFFDPKHNIPLGQSWNTLAQPRSNSRWAALLPGIEVATTIELPYALAGGHPVTKESARVLGHDLARTIRRYLDRQN
ncbi:MAG: M14 family zinc carboxypeptidase [Patescibacteria group bacterium]|nr:M14 family zinc carboxypeptidase [Patescibacteria group bacterium]